MEIKERLSDISPGAWDACAGADNPFLSHTFLGCLEDSGSVSMETGWAPKHVVIRDAHGEVLACAPLYLKSHSLGEYVFDWNWAEAFERAGGRYYPKLLCAVPFTPATGPRLLVRKDLPEPLTRQLKTRLAQTMASLAQAAHLSGVHANFIPEHDIEIFEAAGFTHRLSIQYHWTNNNYQSFDDFLDDLSSRKRKAIKKERREVHNADLTIERLSAHAITQEHWDAMYDFYLDTSTRKWGHPYLNRAFFHLLGERACERVLLVMAKRNGTYIAGALNLIGTEALYGRYWGCAEEIRYLHFEVCYHQAIEAAIQMGLTRVEAGAQGEHKIARGYLPQFTHSAHAIVDNGLRGAVQDFLKHEKRTIRHELDDLMRQSPFRKRNETDKTCL